MKSRLTKLSLFPLMTTVLIGGCGEPGIDPNAEGMPKKDTVPVIGVVRYNGKGVANASVSFQSSDGKITSRGQTDDSGKFESLSTYGTADGAPVGKYKVVVAVNAVQEIEPGVLAPEPPGGFKSPIPARYSSFATTTLTAEVKPGSNPLTLELK